jgi:signal transduction histidine kinase
MIFKSFRVKVIIRLSLICITFWAFAYFIQKEQYYFTTIELFIVAILLVVELVYFIEKGYRQLNSMLQSVKEKDFNITFNPNTGNRVFTKLAQVLNELTENYRITRIEKEIHYQFLNHVVDQVGQVMVCFDDSGNITLVNYATRKLLNVKEVKHISAFSKLDANLPKRFSEISPGQEQLVSSTYGGELLRFTLTCSSIKLQGQNNRLILMHDIRRPLQEQELESYRKLIRVLTHEIMNSVTPILSLSQAMSETLSDSNNSYKSLNELTPQESKDLIEGYFAIEVRSKALMRFVNDFQNLTKLPVPHFEVISIEEILSPVISLLKPTLDGKGISLTVAVPSSKCSLKVDRVLVEQVIINLIKNATEALWQTKNPCIEIGVNRNDITTNITVEDNGMGISEDNFDKVFVPFFSTKQDGSGIGLSLSQQIMQLHSGNITFNSKVGKGTIFTLSFPNSQKSN